MSYCTHSTYAMLIRVPGWPRSICLSAEVQFIRTKPSIEERRALRRKEKRSAQLGEHVGSCTNPRTRCGVRSFNVTISFPNRIIPTTTPLRNMESGLMVAAEGKRSQAFKYALLPVLCLLLEGSHPFYPSSLT